MITHQTMMGALKDQADNNVFHLVGTGGPLSGSSSRADYLPTGFNVAGFGSTYTDLTNGAVYVNEGTKTNLYWTPISYDQAGVLGWRSDFRDGVGKANSDTGATATIPGSGIRVFGSGIAEIDSGLAIAIAEDGAIGTLQATATTGGLLAALGVGITTSVPFQPDRHGPIVVDALCAQSAAITTRRFFIGFLGTAADALANPVTGSTITITLVQDDLAGLTFDTDLTDADRLFAPHNKSDEAATILTTATGVDTGVDVAAAGTYQRFRVEISAAGVMTCFVDKIQVTQISASLDVDEEVAPVLLICAPTTATKAMLVKYFGAWGVRASGV